MKRILITVLLLAICYTEAEGVVISVDTSSIIHALDPFFISFTMDTGRIAGGYAGADLESSRMITMAKAVGPAYLRLSGGRADSLGYNASAAGGRSKETASKHCVGSDCGNCDIANSPGGPPPTVMGAPSTWFNLTAWKRINTFAAAAGLEIIFGLNSAARARSDTAWDGRFGMAELIRWTAKQPFAKYPVSAWELGNEPDLFCRGNSTILPERMVKDFVALRDRLDATGRKYRLLGPDTAGIGDIITNSTTGNPNAIYLHFFSQFVRNLTSLVKDPSRIIDEITFHQYYFKGHSQLTPAS